MRLFRKPVLWNLVPALLQKQPVSWWTPYEQWHSHTATQSKLRWFERSRGEDGNKKIKGIKRHVIVDKNGFLIAVMVTIANVYDSKAAYLLRRVFKEMCSGVKVILADGEYRGELIENIRKNFGYVIQVVISAYKAQGFRPIQKRWIVERSFSCMDYNRRLCRNYELTFDLAEEMVKLAIIRLLLRKI